MDKAQFVPSKQLDLMTHALQGYNPNGSPMTHDQLNQLIPALQAQRDAMAKNRNTTPYQLETLNNLIGIYQANEKNHTDAESKAAALDTQRAQAKKQAEKTGELAVETSPQNIAGQAKLAGAKKAAETANSKQPDTTELNAVAFDPTYQNADGTRGANVVMSKSDAAAKGLTHYKADPNTINAVVGGFNDVQNKLNQLADVVMNPQRMGQVQPGAAAALINHDKGLSLTFGAHGIGASGGIGVDTSRFNEWNYNAAVKEANQATRDFVTAWLGASEAITQLPRLQTFGKSNRMTETQMIQAQKLLPQPGDAGMATQKMTSLQGMIDPLRKQVSHMPGAEQIPSWLEERRQTQPPSGGSNLGRTVMGDTGFINRLVPNQ